MNILKLAQKMQRIALAAYKKYNKKQTRCNNKYIDPVLYPLRIRTVKQCFFVNMY